MWFLQGSFVICANELQSHRQCHGKNKSKGWDFRGKFPIPSSPAGALGVAHPSISCSISLKKPFKLLGFCFVLLEPCVTLISCYTVFTSKHQTFFSLNKRWPSGNENVIENKILHSWINSVLCMLMKFWWHQQKVQWWWSVCVGLSNPRVRIKGDGS